MPKNISKPNVGNNPNSSKRSKMENFHQKLLVSGASDDNNVGRSLMNLCKENTMFVKCLQTMCEVVERG